jgi:3-hydroxyisobutyrate dehydrogenase-like beta-hydroxyacid dehydrogenase
VTIVGVLHPGRMGAAVAGQLTATGHTVLWCRHGRSDETRQRAAHFGLRAVDNLDELLSHADIVFSICPPAAASNVADQVAAHRYRSLYVEANAISPQRMQRIAHALSAAGATVVDGAISGPPPQARHTTRLYLAGPDSATSTVEGLFPGGQLEPIVLSRSIGAASALKMAFASFQKTSRVLAAVAHALAAHHDVTDALVAEAGHMGSRILADRDYLPSVAARAWRWAPEMREIADTLRAANLPTDLVDAAEHALLLLAKEKDNWTLPTEDVLKLLRTKPQANP